ncbi:MAG: hypothetical protein IPQ26_10600 [Elusimicrobia bacterium]|nr:hypothetical protein [Elusimicrobiota bacterium]
MTIRRATASSVCGARGGGDAGHGQQYPHLLDLGGGGIRRPLLLIDLGSPRDFNTVVLNWGNGPRDAPPGCQFLGREN